MEQSDDNILATLQPSQQFVMDKTNHNFSVQTIDIDEALAWHNGLFIFKDETLSQIARQLERWYHIVIEVTASIASKKYSGELNRYKSIEPLLKILRCTDELEFIETQDGKMRIIPSHEKE